MSGRRVLVVEEGGFGGVAEYTDELTRALPSVGWEVDLVTATENSYAPAGGVATHGLFPYVRGRTSLGRAIRRAGLSKAVNGLTHLAANVAAMRIARRCEIVHVQGGEWPPLGAVQALLVRATGRPLVWTPHNTFDRGARSYVRSRALIERCAARIVIHAEHDREALSVAAGSKAVVIAHGEYGGLARRGVSLLDRPTARAAVGASDDELVALLFGQLRPDKGVADLLEAAAGVRGVRVVLAGEDKGALSQVGDLLADRRLHGRVVVLDEFVSPSRAGELFAAADVCALPYHRASASGVLLLAYGYGVPVVVYPVGGLPEYVVDGETGWICARPDPLALVERLRAIVAAGPTARRARGDAARRLADERYAWDQIAWRTAAMYQGLLER